MKTTRAYIALTLLLSLSGCAGLGNLCATANGYEVRTAQGQSAIIIPTKCAILGARI